MTKTDSYMFRGATVRQVSTLEKGETVHRWRGRVRINTTTSMSFTGESKKEVERRIATFLDRK